MNLLDFEVEDQAHSKIRYGQKGTLVMLKVSGQERHFMAFEGHVFKGQGHRQLFWWRHTN